MPSIATDAFVTLLTQRLGATTVLAGADRPARNRTDWSFLPPVDPIAVLRPDSVDQIAEAMRLCHAAGVPVTPQGGLTGLCGGARALDGGVALSLERFTGIEEIDAAAMTMTVRSGTPLEAVQKAAEAEGLFFSLDLGARGSCAIGGNLSTNAGGNRVIRYGMARDLVLGLEVVLPDGTVLSMLNKMIKNNAGYDLKQLFLGSEGTLGVISRAVLRLHPRPGTVQAALCALQSYDDVLALLRLARGRLGPMLSAFEGMWADYWHHATERAGVRAPVAPGHPLYVLIEMQGLDAAIDGARFDAMLAEAFETGIVADGAVAQSLTDVAAFWATRDAAAEFANPAVIGPHCSYDIGLPVARMDEFSTRCKAALTAALGCNSVYYGHVADGNLHIVAWIPGAVPQPLPAISEVVYGLVRDFGGTVSAEHGIGTLKKPYLGYSRSPAELDLMRRLKACLDPEGILNPGKVFD